MRKHDIGMIAIEHYKKDTDFKHSKSMALCYWVVPNCMYFDKIKTVF